MTSHFPDRTHYAGPSRRGPGTCPGKPQRWRAQGGSGIGSGGLPYSPAAYRPHVRGRGARPRAPVQRCGGLAGQEIFGNSVRHSGSGAPGETITVAVRVGDEVVRVEVTDRSGPGVPELDPAGQDAEGGRGLQLVADLAARWGWRRRGGRIVTWFELSPGGPGAGRPARGRPTPGRSTRGCGPGHEQR